MKLLAISHVFLLICMSSTQQQKEGGLTVTEWQYKCKNYFKSNPKATEKAFIIPEYCAKYVCEKFSSGQIAMRVDECPSRMVNGKKCIPMHMKSLPYPECCRLKCFEK